MISVFASPLLAAITLIVLLVVGTYKLYLTKLQPKCYLQVNAVDDLHDYKSVQPRQFRPWKPVYHIVMNISKVQPQDWLDIDCDYDWAVKHHAEVMKEHPNHCCQANPSMETLKACQELYDLVFDVLLQKYPKYFKRQGSYILNTLRNVTIPYRASSTKLPAEQLLRLLVENTEEDFQVLQPDEEIGEIVLRAVGGITSDGFVWSNKLNMKLTDVHGPVPQYKEKLKMSMNRFFGKMRPGEIIQRFTWGVQLGQPSKFHIHHRMVNGSGPDGTLVLSDIDFDNGAWMRVERQCPTRLPKSGFIILTQHTYYYPLHEIRRDGGGELLATAIEAWPDYFANYKSRAPWGPAVCKYLRS